jgi:hypothetical protein
MKRLSIIFFLVLTPILFAQAKGWKIETSESDATITLDGQLFTKYVTDQANKPYFYPIIGPTGASMTRAYPMEDIEGERQDHPHHRGINFGHHELNGFNTWLERASLEGKLKGKTPAEQKDILSIMGFTRHQDYKSIKVTSDHAVMVVTNDYTDHYGNWIMKDERTYTFRAPDKDTRIIDVDITLRAPPHVLTHLADVKDAGLSIRVPHDISVDAGKGGLLINSHGDKNIDSWSKRADWCDYSGTVEGEKVGITFMNHPESFRYPTPWHARTYGLLTANPFGLKSLTSSKEEAEKQLDGTIELKGDESIILKHRFLFHTGDHKSAKVDQAWEEYANEPKLTSVFNGKNLNGWKFGVKDCWNVKDGILMAASDADQTGDILQTKKSYKNFIFQADFKFGTGRVDTGVFLRDTQEQIQIGESGSLKRDMTALAYIPGKGYPIQVTDAQAVFDPKAWNTIKVKVVGNTYHTWLNGRKIMTYTSDTIIPEGPIGIQVHPKREMSVDYRNILVAELSD